MRLPSGVHIGSVSWAGLVVIWLASPPPTGTVQISPCQAKAMVFPSGEMDAERIHEGLFWAPRLRQMPAAANSTAAILFIIIISGVFEFKTDRTVVRSEYFVMD